MSYRVKLLSFVLGALAVLCILIRPGDVVVDLGCGSRYFALKLSSPVGDNGRTIAEDIRRLPLMFLWFRAPAKREHNVQSCTVIRVIHIFQGDAVLISNTYHEFSDSHSILVHVYQSLVSPGGS